MKTNEKTTAKTIRTPKGKMITPKQYLALVRMQTGRDRGTSCCEHGHFDCAGWQDGPCENEVAANAGLIEADEVPADEITERAVADEQRLHDYTAKDGKRYTGGLADEMRRRDAEADDKPKRAPKPRIKQNRWDNWYGYLGSKKVIAFFNSPEETMEEAAQRWLRE